eukprot:Hpha_TRINITY_DN8774_c0_g1::TRINITY_DN8774_c0_g1_i1::g.45357::m.45357
MGLNFLAPGMGLQLCSELVVAEFGGAEGVVFPSVLAAYKDRSVDERVTEMEEETSDRRQMARCGAPDVESALAAQEVDLRNTAARLKAALYKEYGPQIEALYAAEQQQRQAEIEAAQKDCVDPSSPVAPAHRAPVPPPLDTQVRRQMNELQKQSIELLQRELQSSQAPLEEVEGRLNLLLGLEQGKLPAAAHFMGSPPRIE